MLKALWEWFLEKLIGVNLSKRVSSDDNIATMYSAIDKIYNDEQHNKLHEYMAERFKSKVGYFETLEDDNSCFYTSLKIALVILSAFTSLFVGLEAFFSTSIALKIITLILTLFVTVFSTVLTTFNFQEKSLAYQQYRERLITEFYKFHEQLHPYDDNGDRENKFMTRVEGIIGEANRAWDDLQKGKDQ